MTLTAAPQGVPTKTLSRGLLLAFSLPAIMQGFMHAPETLVQGIYAKHAGLSLGIIAGVLLLTRMFDAITYPLIGYLSDATYRRSGTRKPWVLAGTVVTAIGLWFLYRPPAAPSAAWFGGWMMVTYLGWKLTEIPYTAWSIELSGDYVERSRIQLWRSMALMVGGLVFYVVPYAAKALGLTTTAELNFESLGLTAIVIIVLMPLMNLYSLRVVPNGEGNVVAERGAARQSLRVILAAVMRNRPLLWLLAAVVTMNGMSGMAAGVVYLYFDAYLRLGEQLPALMLATGPVAFLALPFWGWACMRWERHRVWALASGIGALAYAGMGFVPAGPGAFVPLIILFPTIMFCLLSAGIAVPALMGDVADYGRLQFGTDQAGMYSAILAFLLKSLGGLSASAGLALLGWFGFDATAAEQSRSGALGMNVVAVWLPAAGLAAGALVAWNFPISRARQREIRSQLMARTEP